MILVTGATGKVGGEVVKQLLAKGEPVRVLARSPEKARSRFGDGVEVARGDFGDPASVAAALEGVDRLFLLPPNSPEQPAQERGAIEAAKRAGVRRVVKLSALGAAHDSPVTLARWHKEAEDALAASGLPYTVLQPGFFAQNFLASAPTIQAQDAVYSSAQGKAAFVDVRDVAAVAVAALTEDGHEGKTYVITGPEAISYAQAAEKLSAATGRAISFVQVPDEAVRAAMIEAGLPGWYADDLVALNGVINAGWAEGVTDVVATVAKKEPISFDQFARDHAAAFAPQPAAV